MTEPGAGSDLRGIASTAKWRGEHWELNGSKTFVTNGILADLVIVAARVRGRDTEGLGAVRRRVPHAGLSARAQAGQGGPARAGHGGAVLRVGGGARPRT